MADTEKTRRSWTFWLGWVLTVLPSLLLTFSGAMKLSHSPEVVATFTGQFGYGESVLALIGALEIACVIVYLFPRTAVLGAILLTGYLGGAVATHVRIGDKMAAMPALLGVLAWAGLYLRDVRLRELLPWRKDAPVRPPAA